MEYYLLTLNIEYFKWEEAPVRTYNGIETKRWSCGRNKQIKSGDRVFFLKQGQGERGIFAQGEVKCAVYQEEHWNIKNQEANYVDVEVKEEVSYDSEYFMTREYLIRMFEEVNWSPMSGGVGLDIEVGEYLWEIFGTTKESEYIAPYQEEDRKGYLEGAVTKVVVNKYERNPKARKRCIDYYGYNCYACGEDLEDKYGEEGKNFIHIHHEKPLNTIREGYEVDPIKDLKPVCPNCHGIIHRKKDYLTMEQLKNIIKKK